MEKFDVGKLKEMKEIPKEKDVSVPKLTINDQSITTTQSHPPQLNIPQLSLQQPSQLLHHLEFHSQQPNKGKWNKRTELLLYKINEKASAYRWMHDQEYQQCEKINDIYSMIEVILLAVMAALQGGTFVTFASTSNLDDNKIVYIVLNVIVIVLIIITSIVTGLKNNGEFKKNGQQHKYTSNKFYEISLEIQYQFTLDLDRRDGDKEFIMKIISKFNDLLQLSLPIGKKTREKYIETKLNDSDITMPINLCDINDDIAYQNRGNGNNANNTNNGDNEDNGDNVEIVVEPISKNIDKKLNNEIDRWLKNF